MFIIVDCIREQIAVNIWKPPTCLTIGKQFKNSQEIYSMEQAITQPDHWNVFVKIQKYII